MVHRLYSDISKGLIAEISITTTFTESKFFIFNARFLLEWSL